MSSVSLSDTADNQRMKIQQNTFTRWVNENLKTENKSVSNLATGFSDGTALISLVEVLSGKRFKKYVTKPKMRIHKLENVTTVLTFLQKDEKIKLVNIDSAAIVDSKLLLILGLVWSLILHYSFHKSVWHGEKVKTKPTDSPKNRLMIWINERSKVKIRNFTTDWNSGIALGALIEAVSPGVLGEWKTWNAKNALQNATKALMVAETSLNVVQLIKPAELINPNVDEMSVITYLSQFPKIKIGKVSSTLSIESKTASRSSIVQKSSTAAIKMYSHKIGYVTGRGVQPKGLRIGDAGMFTVNINAEPGKNLKATISVQGGKEEMANVRQISTGVYEVTYEIKVTGKYVLKVTYGDEHVQGSPFVVNVGPKITSQIVVYGPGLETGVAGCTSAFVIENFGKQTEIRYTVCGPVECWIGVYQEHDGTAMTSFEPTAPGEYAIHLTTLDSEHLPNSPYVVNIKPKPDNFDPKQVVVTGSGYRNNVFLNEELELFIETKLAGSGKIDVKVYDYQQKPINVSFNGNKAAFKCVKREKHIVMVTFGGVLVPTFPFEIYVHDHSLVNISGPALSGQSKVGQVTEFTVDATKTDRGDVSMIVIDAKKREVPYNIVGLQQRSFKVTFTPKSAGVHQAYIYFADNKLPSTPIKIQVV